MKKMICDSSDRQNINPRPWKCWVDGTYHIIITSHVILLTLPSGAIETKQTPYLGLPADSPWPALSASTSGLSRATESAST